MCGWASDGRRWPEEEEEEEKKKKAWRYGGMAVWGAGVYSSWVSLQSRKSVRDADADEVEDCKNREPDLPARSVVGGGAGTPVADEISKDCLGFPCPG